MSALSYSDALQRLIWDNSTLQWLVQVALPCDQCDNYGKCGSNAICTINDPRICSCLAGYVPKSSQEWDVLIWSGGCVRKVPLGCPAGEGFFALERVKKPDLLQYRINTSMTLQECEVECLKNCSCTAYANSNVTGGGSGCLLWFEDLVDIRKLDEAANNKLYIRVPASDLPPISEPKKKKNVVVVPVAGDASIAVVLLIVSFSIWKCRLGKEGTVQRLIWDNSTLEWLVQVALPRHQCDNYGNCGPNAICTINDPRICSCLAGYVPKSLQDWDVLIWSGGCVRKIPLDCPVGEGFIALEKVKKPDFLKFWINTSMRLQECEVECLKNCSCTAYADLNVTVGGSGCLLWFEDLVDIRKLEEAANQKLYIRVPASDLRIYL
ncbi:hypothetical protein RJ639_036595 [Escallonia herrerae]|uniref:Apple domain-containing protein n=1 Tax=Escallonia herrerae TaxID=1293975 RepID=A0AA88WY05_9ASTE|nr:hypothetical protein RJ639_036595 [Escallonia herrerae]